MKRFRFQTKKTMQWRHRAQRVSLKQHGFEWRFVNFSYYNQANFDISLFACFVDKAQFGHTQIAQY